MRVRGVGQLKLQVETQEVGSEHLCVVGIHTPPVAGGIGLRGHTDVGMTLYPKKGLSPDRLNRILEEAKFKGGPGEALDSKAPNVLLVRSDDSHDGKYKTLLVQCRGPVEDVEGLLKKVVIILTKSVRIIDDVRTF